MGRVCHGPSLYGPSLLWAEFAMGRVCYGPSCPVTAQGYVYLDHSCGLNDLKPETTSKRFSCENVNAFEEKCCC